MATRIDLYDALATAERRVNDARHYVHAWTRVEMDAVEVQENILWAIELLTEILADVDEGVYPLTDEEG